MTKKVGVIGAGQLAQMLGEAAVPLELKILALTNDPNFCAKNTVELVIGDEHDPQAIQKLAEQVDVITFEHEHIETELFNELNAKREVVPNYIVSRIPLARSDKAAAATGSRALAIHPNVAAVCIAQNRGLEKNFFKKLGIPTPKFVVVNSIAELEQAVETIGVPCVLKTVEGGYDGKGQKVLKQKTDLDLVWQELGAQTLIVEGWMTFEREVSLVAVRAIDGEIVFYPLTENQHRDGILRVSKAPYHDVKLQQLAEKYLTEILQALNYVGVLTVEFFQCGNQLVANEMAPRVHNSGHWTIEGAQTSQFSNHLRAVTGKPLGDTKTKGFVAMINIIGQWPDEQKIQNLRDGAQADPFLLGKKVPQRQDPESSVHIHDYGKAPRAGRKLGHLTLVVATETERDEKLKEVLEIIN